MLLLLLFDVQKLCAIRARNVVLLRYDRPRHWHLPNMVLSLNSWQKFVSNPMLWIFRAECEKQVKGFSGARYKKLGTLLESECFFKQNIRANDPKWSLIEVPPGIQVELEPEFRFKTDSKCQAKIMPKVGIRTEMRTGLSIGNGYPTVISNKVFKLHAKKTIVVFN